MLRAGGMVLVIAFLSPQLRAQDYPAAEIFGGFSILSVGDDGFRETGYGWQAGYSTSAYRDLAFVGDFAGQYKTLDLFGDDVTFQVYQYLFGPRYTIRGERVTAFLHGLVGGVSLRAEGESVNGVLLGLGGGLDFNVSPGMAVRLPQFDYLPVQLEGEWFTKSFRVGVGLVWKIGGG